MPECSLKRRLPVGALVRVTRDLHFYPIALGRLGTILAYAGLRAFAWKRGRMNHSYTVHFDPPHAYGGTIVLTDDEIEPLD